MSEEINQTTYTAQTSETLEAAPAAAQQAFPSENKAWAVAFAGWLLPGLGHALQRMWGRALVVFCAVGLLVVVGGSMRGNLFTSQGNDAFDTLGYVADLGSGSFYFVARSVEHYGADV